MQASLNICGEIVTAGVAGGGLAQAVNSCAAAGAPDANSAIAPADDSHRLRDRRVVKNLESKAIE
jgi:hypothetical protein